MSLRVISLTQFTFRISPSGNNIVSTNLKLYFILSECGSSVIFPASFKGTMQTNTPLLGASFETFAFGQLLRSLRSQGKTDEVYYFGDKDGREVDFLIPTGNLLNLYECKWNDESGTIPKNITRLIPVFGEENIGQITTITTAVNKTRISHNFSVSNVVEF
ncbi:MAG: DUF4143 domain-containing protein [Gammaproteobacteria bacterium]|nr:DUF4143 domain-containing protein [Gammaproteobacteria bacterium]